MKARIDKKLSKRLVEITGLFKDAWIDEEPSELADSQGTSVSHIWSVGGGVDYWGEGHRFEGYPNIDGFKATTQNLLRLATEYGRDKA